MNLLLISSMPLHSEACPAAQGLVEATVCRLGKSLADVSCPTGFERPLPDALGSTSAKFNVEDKSEEQAIPRGKPTVPTSKFEKLLISLPDSRPFKTSAQSSKQKILFLNSC